MVGTRYDKVHVSNNIVEVILNQPTGYLLCKTLDVENVTSLHGLMQLSEVNISSLSHKGKD